MISNRNLAEINYLLPSAPDVPDVSLVVPIKDKIRQLALLIVSNLVCVDDGSVDCCSVQFTREQSKIRDNLKAVILRCKYG
ncbi:hypothetical protein [Richelia intracellularis]|uniref:hypothetical protein n=1 Tax=Richelia intracellularis TaxID=1164990 RepID=UPI00034D3430|nr:hypothetical protein [Richelia intracellularis]